MSVVRASAGTLLCIAFMACSPPGETDYGKAMDAYAEKRFTDAAPYLQKSSEAGHLLGMATLAGMVCKMPRHRARLNTGR